MTLEPIAQTDVVTAFEDERISDLAATMAEERVGSVVIINESGEPLGIITDRDLALDVLGVGINPASLSASELMTETLYTTTMDSSVFDLIGLMAEYGVRRVPIVDEDALVGIVALDDVLVYIAEELSGLASVIDTESPQLR